MLYNQFIQFTPDVSLLTEIANSIIKSRDELSIKKVNIRNNEGMFVLTEKIFEKAYKRSLFAVIIWGRKI
jgi:hypothetical protein